MPEQLILASSSPRRRELLEKIGFSLRVVPAEISEVALEGESPENYVKRLARAKAVAAVERVRQTLYPEHQTTLPQENARWVLGADTAVVIDGTILGKPKDNDEAMEMLRMLEGRIHYVITGFCLYDIHKSKEGLQAVTTQVKMKPMTIPEIERYVSIGEGLDKAGAYAIQGVGAYLVEYINGSYTNVVGLPLSQVVEMMQEMGADSILPF